MMSDDTRLIVEDVLEQVLRYRPKEPLEFVVKVLDEMMNKEKDMSCERLRLARAQSEKHEMDEICTVYSDCVARNGTHALNSDVLPLVRSLCPAVSAIVEERCCQQPKQVISFETFCAILRFILSYQAIQAELMTLFQQRTQIRLIDAHLDDCDQVGKSVHPMDRKLPALKHFLRRFVSDQPRSYHDLFTKTDLQQAALFDYALSDLNHLLLLSSSSKKALSPSTVSSRLTSAYNEKNRSLTQPSVSSSFCLGSSSSLNKDSILC